MPVRVDVSQFSANSPLDYADLNKLVTAIQVVAAAIPDVKSPAPIGSGTGTPTSPTILAQHVSGIPGSEITKTNNSGKSTRVPFIRNGKQVTFTAKPLVVAMASHSSVKGVAVVNITSTDTTGFDAQVGWVGKEKGNIGLKYIAVGTEVAVNENKQESETGSTGNQNPLGFGNYWDEKIL